MDFIIRKLKNKKGFTLVESIVAISVLAVASMMFATFISTSYRLTTLTIKNQEDYQILQEAIQKNDFEGVKIEVFDKKTEKDENDKDVEVDNYFILDFSDVADIKIKGSYIIATQKETNKQFAIFIGNKYNKSSE